MIGVAISTHARPAVLARALTGWAKVMPDRLVVIHDAAGAGVAATKNAGLAALMDLGCEHLFLADDDVWPVGAGWADPYVRSAEPHLMHCWGRSRFLRDDPARGVSVWSWPRGVLLYAHRSVIEKVGGMRTEFLHAGEHAEWSRRIHSAGLTAHPFQDALLARSGVWHCEDYVRAVASSLPAARYSTEAAAARKQLYARFAGSTDFVEYR